MLYHFIIFSSYPGPQRGPPVPRPHRVLLPGVIVMILIIIIIIIILATPTSFNEGNASSQCPVSWSSSTFSTK